MMNYSHMSWKHILKAARRLGTPVIIADESGKDPFVVMTLSKYEDMVEENELFTDMEPGEGGFEEDEEDFDDDFNGLDPRLEKVFEDEIKLETVNFAEQKEDLAGKPSLEPLSEVQENGQNKGEMPLEDRFYFEPLEDEFKK